MNQAKPKGAYLPRQGKFRFDNSFSCSYLPHIRCKKIVQLRVDSDRNDNLSKALYLSKWRIVPPHSYRKIQCHKKVQLYPLHK